MNKPATAVGVFLLVLSTSNCDKRTKDVVGAGYQFSPALIDRNQMHVFRLNGTEDDLALPSILTQITYSHSGKSVFGFDRTRPGLFKLELDSMRLSTVTGSSDLRGVASFTISSDEQRIVFSSQYPVGGSRICGLFELRPATGDVSLLVQNDDCGGRTESFPVGLLMWSELNLSPDGERVLVHNRSGLKIVNIAKGTVDSLGEQFAVGTWSPDGRWLAVVESNGRERTLLLDAKTLRQERTLGSSTAAWSPDSRYLLGRAPYDLCGPYWYTLQLIDVNDRRRYTVPSSKCKVNVNTAGWICQKDCDAGSHR